MREIKFRAYGTGEYADYDGEPRMVYLMDMPRTGKLSDLEEDDDWKVMQYTGLKDKNGIEIYEGDIVHNSPDGIVAYTRVVEYKGNRFLLSHLADSLQHKIDWTRQVEVIGNIYQNPALLEKS